jgi:hypothetical protein
MIVDFENLASWIKSGRTFFLAGDESLLRRLPKGNWIGGTIPYFMDAKGGVTSKKDIFATEAPVMASGFKIAWYGEKELQRLVPDAPDNGFSLVIIPATSPAHISFARNAPDYEGIFLKPIIGWIAGVHLDDLGKISPKVINGATGEFSETKAIAMHVALPSNKQATIGIINLFRQGKGEVISFDQEGFSVEHCLVGGKRLNFAEYLLSRKIDTRLPLVANYCGTMVNVSFQSIDETKKSVALYAPVFKNVEYRIAEPIQDYIRGFSASIHAGSVNPAFSCNCILNYLYANLEGKKTGSITGPITFGEIAYQLLNQTLVYLDIADIEN